MGTEQRSRGFTFANVLVAASISICASLLVPAALSSIRQDEGIDDSSTQHCRQMSLAGIMYGGDYDDEMPILINGQYRDLLDIADGKLTRSGSQRTDGWPMLVLPYIRSRDLFVDPSRIDGLGIWSGAPRAIGQDGYESGKNTYRNQNLFPMYAINYMFCSPGVIPKDKIGKPNAMDYMIGEGHSFVEADDPSGTVFFVPSRYYGASAQGFFVANAPGMWQAMKTNSKYAVFWGGGPCSGDWCYDTNEKRAGAQSQTNSVWFDREHKTPVSFLDGHVRVFSDLKIAAGTDYETAVPTDGPRPKSKGGGAVITDKNRYLWNLTDNYLGL